MALNSRLSEAARNAAINAIATLVDGGTLDIYSGTQPTDPDTAIGAQVLLASLALNADAFAAAASGSAAANAITDDSSADATGTAAWASFVASGGARVLDVSVGTSGANINLVTTSIVATQPVSITGFTLSLPLQGS